VGLDSELDVQELPQRNRSRQSKKDSKGWAEVELTVVRREQADPQVPPFEKMRMFSKANGGFEGFLMSESTSCWMLSIPSRTLEREH